MELEHPLHRDLLALGFRLHPQRRGELRYVLQANPYLAFWVHWDPGQDWVVFTWELAVGEFMSDRDLQIGSNEALNLFLFPQRDARGPAEAAFVVGEIQRAQRILASLDFVGATRPGAG